MPRVLARVRTAPLREMGRRVTVMDGTSEEAHLRSFLESPRVSGTVFESLRNPAVFRQVRVHLGAVCC